MRSGSTDFVAAGATFGKSAFGYGVCSGVSSAALLLVTVVAAVADERLARVGSVLDRDPEMIATLWLVTAAVQSP
jgi:hypothetical protein